MADNAQKTLDDLLETLEDGRKGFEQGAEKLADSDRPEWASTFRRLAEQRRRFADELRQVGRQHGYETGDGGSFLATLHRGWMSLKDALAGSDPHGVLDAAEQGEDHAKREFEQALEHDDLDGDLRTVISRQHTEIVDAHDEVKRLRDATG